MVQQRFKHIWENLRGSNIRGMRILRYIRGVVLIFCSSYFPHNFPIFPTFSIYDLGFSGHHDAPQAQNLGEPNSPAKALRSETCKPVCDFGGPGVKLPLGKHTKNYRKVPFFGGKSSISLVIFNSNLLVYQKVQSTPQRKHADSCIPNRKSYFDPVSSMISSL